MLNTKNLAGTAVTYSRYRSAGNRTEYVGPANSDLTKDQIILQSTAPKTQGENRGNRRSSVNVVSGVSVLNTKGVSVVRDAKLELLASVPAGMTEGDFKELCARQAALLADPTFVKNLFLTGLIDY